MSFSKSKHFNCYYHDISLLLCLLYIYVINYEYKIRNTARSAFNEIHEAILFHKYNAVKSIKIYHFTIVYSIYNYLFVLVCIRCRDSCCVML